METPIHPRTTLPFSRSWATTFFATLLGMAKPMPCPVATMAVVIPTTSPRRLMSGPPLLPGLTGASVWRKLSYGPVPMTLPVALMMPCVTVWARPKGFPTASTQSPTRILSESPSESTGRPCTGVAILIRERSVFESLPTTFALNSLPSVRRTVISARPPHHVVVGQDVARLIDDDAGAQAPLLQLPVGYVAEKPFEEAVELPLSPPAPPGRRRTEKGCRGSSRW